MIPVFADSIQQAIEYAKDKLKDSKIKLTKLNKKHKNNQVYGQ